MHNLTSLRTEGVWGEPNPLSMLLAGMWGDIRYGEPTPIVDISPNGAHYNQTAVQSHWLPYQAREKWHECRIWAASNVLAKHHPAVATIETDWPEWQWVSYPTAIDVVCGMAATILDQTDLATMSDDDATAAVQSRLPKVDGRTAAEIHARLMQELQEVAHILDASSPAETKSEPQEVPQSNDMRWDADARKLWCDDECIATFGGQIRKGVLPTILAAFQEDDWPPSIDNPVPGNATFEQTKGAVRSFNAKLKPHGFQFNVDGVRIIFSRFSK